MSGSVSSCVQEPVPLREAVLAGPGAPAVTCVEAATGWNPLAAVASPAAVRAALAAVGHVDKCRGILTGAVTTVLVVGLCLYCGEGVPSVIEPLLQSNVASSAATGSLIVELQSCKPFWTQK